MKNKSLHNLTVCFKFAFIDWGKKKTDVYHGLLEYSKHRKHFIATMLKIDIFVLQICRH